MASNSKTEGLKRVSFKDKTYFIPIEPKSVAKIKEESKSLSPTHKISVQQYILYKFIKSIWKVRKYF